MADAVLVDHLPVAGAVGIGGHPLEHHGGRAIGERPVHDVAVAGDPADVGRAPEDVAAVDVEHVLVGHRHREQVAGGGVHDAFGLAGRARRVQDEQRIFRVHGLGLAPRCLRHDQVVIPDVPALGPIHLASGAPQHHRRLHRWAPLQGFVRIRLHRNAAAATQAFVGGDQHLRTAILDPVGKGFRREPGEDHRVDGADARTGEHRNRGLGHHRQVDGHPVALANAQGLQAVGQSAHFGVQFRVADPPRLGGVVALPDDGGARAEVPIETVHARVQLAVAEPPDVDVAGSVGHVADPGRRRDPVEGRGPLGPELFRLPKRALVLAAIRALVDPGAALPVFRHGEGHFAAWHGMLLFAGPPTVRGRPA